MLYEQLLKQGREMYIFTKVDNISIEEKTFYTRLNEIYERETFKRKFKVQFQILCFIMDSKSLRSVLMEHNSIMVSILMR